jgi:predicted Zn-dependent protease with MMP-like domain
MYRVDKETFDAFVQEGVDAIDKQFRDKFDNLVIFTEDYPTVEQQRKIKLQKGHLLFGLYEGIALTRRNSSYSGVPDVITIFKHPIEIYSEDEEHMKRVVKNTVWHEVAHYFGMNEFEVRAAEKNRGHIY